MDHIYIGAKLIMPVAVKAVPGCYRIVYTSGKLGQVAEQNYRYSSAVAQVFHRSTNQRTP